jgi:hypothetical protein
MQLRTLSFADAMLRIHRALEDQGVVVFTLSGRIRSEEAAELRRLVRAENQKVILDLNEVRLVDRAAIAFLAQCQAEGVRLRNAPAYIQEWVNRETVARATTALPQDSN